MIGVSVNPARSAGMWAATLRGLAPILNSNSAKRIITQCGKKGFTMRITTKGQVTIPQDVRERAGLMPGTDVEFEIEAGVVRLVKATRGGGRQTRRKGEIGFGE